MTDIAKTLTSAREIQGQVWLTNYQSSDGKVANYRLQVHNADFYPLLIRRSIGMLQSIIETEAQERPTGLPSIAALKVAAARLLTTLQQRQVTFEEQSKNASALPAEHPNLQLTPDGAYMVRNVEVLETVVVQEPPAKTSKRAAIPKEYTQDEQAERWIRDNWPLKLYGASFKLAPGKFSSIQPAK